MKKNKRSDAYDVPSTRSSFFVLPAIQALLVQALSFFLTVLLQSLLTAVGVALPFVVISVGQGTIAALLSRWRGLAPWWIAIQFFFPVLLVLGLSLQLPPTLFLVVFLALLFLYWTTFRTQVPFYPSRLSVWNEVANLLPAEWAVKFVDIGSGLGGLVLNLADRFPHACFLGVEVAPLPWAISSLRAKLCGKPVNFQRVDYNNLNLADYDVVFAYLSPAAMPALWKKARTEMRSGTMLLSYEFVIPDAKPSMVISPDDGGAKLYVFQM